MSADEKRTIPSLQTYHLLGRTGLRVSPLCLGTMTFGTDWGWGSDEDESRRVLHRFLEAGGNFIDTADGYTNGHSEEMLGKFLAEPGMRDRVVLATKFTFNASTGDPNAGGNGRKNIYRALEGSLRRLHTDHVDLYWLHAWDTLTPVEEVMSTIDALVREGKVRYFGLSDVPAWYAARAQSIAWLRGWAPVAAMQLEYSLVERNIEREHVPSALHLGLGITPWSPLAGGFLSGKYRRASDDVAGEGRLQAMKDPSNRLFYRFTDRNWKILETLQEVARELGRSPAQIAVNWITRRPGVASTIIGARDGNQLEENLRSLEFVIPEELSCRLEEASRPEFGFPYTFFSGPTQQRIAGGVPVRREPEWFRG